MIALDPTEFARNCTSNAVYPLSIAEGFQEGKIVFSKDKNEAIDANHENEKEAALFWHYCGFAYLSGNVDDLFLEKIYQDYFVKNIDRILKNHLIRSNILLKIGFRLQFGMENV